MEQADIEKQAAEAEAALIKPDSLQRFKEYLERQSNFCEGSRTPGMYASILSFFQRQDKDLLLFLSSKGKHTNPIYRGAIKRALVCFGFSELARNIRGHKIPVKRQAITTTKEERELIIQNIEGIDHRMMALVQHDTGCRASEVVNLTREQITDPEDGRNKIRVIGKGGKEMEYYLSRGTSEALQAHMLTKESGYLFRDESLTPHTNYCRYWAAVRKASKIALKGKIHDKFYTHGFRYGMAYDMLNSGATLLDIKEALNHADISTTTVYLQKTGRKSLENVKMLRED